MVNYDLAIIGAGPAGSLAAWEAAQTSGISISIFEEHLQVGKPPHCSGLISMDGFLNLGLNMHDIRRKLSYNMISRAKFISPNYISVEINRGPDSMIVLDRVALDQYLATRAQKLSCEYRLGNRVKKIKFDGSNWTLFSQNSGKRKFCCNLLISAEGGHCRLAKSIGLPTPSKKWLFPAIQFEFERVKDIETDCVEIYFGQKYAPGFFGWFIPITENSARLGIAVGPWNKIKTRFFMKKFLKKHPSLCKRLRKAKLTKTYGGFVPATGPVKKTYYYNFMTVGDAAGQSKATTGGGLNIGGFCGRLAGLMARKIYSEEVEVSIGCREYQRKWQTIFEPDLTLMKLFRRMMTFLPDKTWDSIIQIAKETDIGESMKSTSVDLHGLGLLRYALTPRVFISGLHLVPQTAASFLQGLLF
ncbi:MAG: geranylgeranyl reductase family protein [Candidatus Hodarchaeota archaeon]